MRDDTGLMSIDFIAGFTIFMIALIIAITMSSGLLIGLQSKTIDYDAVAYRTSVILAEDPGAVNITGVTGNPITTDPTSWELVYLPLKEDSTADYYKNYISRMGLAIAKSYDNPDILSQQRTPNILSLAKINRFFDTSLFYSYDRTDSSGNIIPSDYREKVIFGDYPYKFYITLNSINSGDSIHKAVGDPNVPNASYGYMRRVVMVKDPAANFTANTSPTSSNIMNISMDFNQIYQFSSPRGPLYQINPNVDEIAFNISGFNIVNYTSQAPKIALNSMNISRFDLLSNTWPNLPIYVDSPTVKIYLNEPNATSPSESNRWSGATGNVTSSILIIFEPGYFPRTVGYTSAETDIIRGNFTFSPSNHVGQPTFVYSYTNPDGTSNQANPVLKPCVLEVSVW